MAGKARFRVIQGKTGEAGPGRHLHVVEAQAGDAADGRRAHDVGGVQAPAQADLQHGHVHALLQEDVQACACASARD